MTGERPDSLTVRPGVPSFEPMEIPLAPDMERKLAELAATTGRTADDLVRDAIASYLDELAVIRQTLDRRHDDLKTGRVQAIEGEQALGLLREMSKQRRSKPG